ncbi:MAG: FAD-binding oxidoreductase [Jiangellaceae bacterium]|nr:FAD-binding oxidoreductase [Jiangellaceae bacterium]
MRTPDVLLRRLADAVGFEHVLSDDTVTAGYTTDWTGRWHGPTTAVVRPGSTAEVSEVVRVCAAAGVGVVPQGGNTGLVGASVPVHGEVVLNLRRLNSIESVDSVGRTLAAQAGVTVATAQQAAADAGLMVGVDLAARESATLGGIVATNAGGLRVVRHGTTRAQVVGVEAVLADGAVLRRWTGLAKDNVGYDLVGLLTGSEGTLAVITKVLLRLAPRPVRVQVALVGVPSLDAALEVLSANVDAGHTVEAAEFFHGDGLALVRETLGLHRPLGADYPTYLLLELSNVSEDDVAAVLTGCTAVGDATIGPGPASRLWAYRESHTEAVSAAAASLGTPAVKVDVSVPLPRLQSFEDEVRAVVGARFSTVDVITYGHLAEGNSHVNLLGVPDTEAEDATDTVLRLVVDHGGSISAEHGVGRAKRRWLPLVRSAADVAAMQAVKRAFDPAGIFSPGVLLP